MRYRTDIPAARFKGTRVFACGVIILLLLIPLIGFPVEVHIKAQVNEGGAPVNNADQLLQEAKRLISDAETASDFRKAETALKAAQNLYQAAGNAYKAQLAEVFHQLGKIYLLQGELQQSFESFQQALPLREDSDARGKGATLNNLGVVCNDLGKFQESMEYYFQALPFRREASKMDYADTITNIAIGFRHFGRPYEGLKFYEQLRPIYKEIGESEDDWSGLADLFHSIGNFYLDNDKLDEAAENFKEAIRLHSLEAERMHNKAQNERGAAIAWDSLGLVYKALGQYEDALSAHQRAFTLYKGVNDTEGIGITFTNEGALFEDLGRYEEGIAAYKHSLEISKQTKSLEDRSYALYGLGRIYQKLHQSAQAHDYFQQAVETLEKLRGTITVTEALQGFSSSRNSVYHSLVSLLADEHRPVEAFNLAEQFRARSLRENLVRGILDWKKLLPTDLYNKKEEIEKRLVELDHKISSIAGELAGIPSSSGKKKELETELNNTAKRREERALDNLGLEIEISRYIPRNSLPNESITLETLQRLLGSDTAFLEYFFGEDVDPVLLFVVTSNTFNIYSLGLNSNKTKGLITSYTDALSRSEGDSFLQTAVGQQLHHILLQPAAADLEGKTKLIISADSALQRLPFEAIVQPADKSPSFLVENHEIFYVPSATVWKMLSEGSEGISDPPQNDLLAFAVPSYPKVRQVEPALEDEFSYKTLARLDLNRLDLNPMPYCKNEVTQASRYASFRSQVYVGEAATKRQLKELDLSQFQVIHFAVHAAGDENPSNCFMALYVDPTKDDLSEGLLRIKELAALPMNAKLVVLSACETGRGFEFTGEGVQSLAQAIIFSGARSVVASQWKVDDEATAEFMNEFYKSLSQGESESSALRSAKLHLLHTRWRHPRYWAAFVLTGNGLARVVIHPEPWWRLSQAQYFLVPILLVAILLFGWWIRRLWSKSRQRQSPLRP